MSDLKKLFEASDSPADGRTLRSERGSYQKKEKQQFTLQLDLEELKQPGGVLLSLLFKKAATNGHNLQELASQLGVTYPYLAQLRKGLRKVENISAEFAKNCAAYLNAPTLFVLMVAGKISQEDMMEKESLTMAQLDHAYDFVKNDLIHGGSFMPGELFEVSASSKLFIIRLFEKASGLRLIDEEMSFEMAEKIASKLSAVREEVLKNSLTHSKVHKLNDA